MAAAPNNTPADSQPPKRKFGPMQAGLVFVLLLMVGLIWAQFSTYSGPVVRWLNDHDEALKQAQANGRRVFLYLHEPNDPVTRDMDRSVFTARWAREPLSRMVACRIELRPRDPLRVRYRFEAGPLTLVLDANGKEISRKEGALDERWFYGYVQPK